MTSAFLRRLEAGDTGEHLLRPLDLGETHRVGWGCRGDETDVLILARWAALRHRAA
jgi:hypothetical protein